jgi:hypothetical protein
MSRWNRRVTYGVAAVAVALLLTGLTVAVIDLSTQSENAVGNYTEYNGVVAGLRYSSTVAGRVPNPAPGVSTGSALVPQFLSGGSNAFCGNSCVANHLALNVTYAFNASMAGAVQITIQVTSGGGTGSSILYLRQALVPTSGSVVIVWDIGTALSMLADVTITIHQCGPVTCP